MDGRKMAIPLDETETRISDEIKRVAERFNEVNKNFKEIKKLLIQDKTALIVISQNFERRTEKLQEFVNSVNNMIKNLIERFNNLHSNLNKVIKESDAIKRDLQMQYQSGGTRALEFIDAQFATSLSTDEKLIENFLARLPSFEIGLNAFASQIISQRGNQRHEFIVSTIDSFYNIINAFHLQFQAHMKLILSYYKYQFLVYRSAKG